MYVHQQRSQGERWTPSRISPRARVLRAKWTRYAQTLHFAEEALARARAVGLSRKICTTNPARPRVLLAGRGKKMNKNSLNAQERFNSRYVNRTASVSYIRERLCLPTRVEGFVCRVTILFQTFVHRFGSQARSKVSKHEDVKYILNFAFRHLGPFREGKRTILLSPSSHLLAWCRGHSGSVAFCPSVVWGLPHWTSERPGDFRPWRRPLCSLPGWPRRCFPCAYLNQPPHRGHHRAVPCPRTRSRPTLHLKIIITDGCAKSHLIRQVLRALLSRFFYRFKRFDDLHKRETRTEKI